MDYIRAGHSKHLLMVHLIFVTKYRHKLLIKYGKEIKDLFQDISKENNLNIKSMLRLASTNL